MTWHSEVYQHLLQEQYEQVAHFYENVVDSEPEVISHGWYLGLAYLLQEQEEAAQATWLFIIDQVDEQEAAAQIDELVLILDAEAQRQSDLGQLQNAWLIRHHIRQFNPIHLNNLLKLTSLSIDLQRFEIETLTDWQTIQLLQRNEQGDINVELLLEVFPKIIEIPHQNSLDFAEACIAHIPEPQNLIDIVLPIALKIAYQSRRLYYAIALGEYCLKISPEHFDCLKSITRLHIETGNYVKAIELAQKNTSINHGSLIADLLGNATLLWTLIRAGHWDKIPKAAEKYKKSLNEINQRDNLQLTEFSLEATREASLQSSLFCYCQDNPQENKTLQSTITKLFLDKVQTCYFSETNNLDRQFYYAAPHSNNQKLKIGYIGHTFRVHSVAWLCRGLFQHHNRDLFDIGIYFVGQNQVHQNINNSFFQDWFAKKVDFVHGFGYDPQPIAEQIVADNVDILIDLDSTTLDLTYTVMALKPAPVQATWLGFDASSLSTVDYFIADPYVLPLEAQAYYPEKIWRLPSTYIAVDGFEVDVPRLRREDLNLPTNAVTFLSAQAGMKRHPDTVRLQMQIVKEVSNGYLLVKGLSDEDQIQAFFKQMAEEVGLNPNRLRFLPRDPNEYVHRANLQIADVVLDTYPYNGATTTLETLWMNIPVVTRVGQQFAARNSYAFLMNAGVTEGIAWTDEEYVEWGIRLGCDEQLRQQIAWKLKISKQRSPLWNAKQFTMEMEKAYQQMWETYKCSVSH